MRLSDAMKMKRKEREDFDKKFSKINAKALERRAKYTPRTDLHPSVGVLIGRRGVRYYAYVRGVYTEGTPETLAQMLTN